MTQTYYGFNPLSVDGYSIGLERIANMEDELRVLHTEHYNETETLYMQDEVDVDYERYRASEAANQFVVFTVRTAERMVGYLQFYVFRDMHSKNVLQAREDAYFLTKSERGTGLASVLLGYAEQCLKQLGCRYVGMTSKGPVGGPDIGNFLERKGYRPVAMYYSKLLEDS
jgi:GNAT superfamily N-acetyltransferase